MADETISVAIIEEGGGGNKLVQVLINMAGAADKAAVSIDKAKNSTKAQGDAATKASSDNNTLSKAIGGVQGNYGLLSAAIGGLLGKLTLEKLTSYADTYTNIRNKLQLVTPTQLATNAAMDASFAIAQRTRTSWEATAGVYGKVQQALQDMNKPAADTARITETISKAVALSGSSAEAAKNGLKQFEQALASGVLRGDEFNSVMENTPGLARAIADGLNVPIGALRKMAEAGELTADKVVGALQKVAGKIDSAFKQAAPTISQAWQSIENATMKYIGTANQANGFSALLANTMLGLANNMNVVAPIMATIVGLLVAMAAVSILTTLYGMVTAFTALATAAAAAGVGIASAFAIPLGIAAAAMTAAATIAYALGYSFQDLATKVLDLLSKIPGLGQVVDDLRAKWNSSGEAAKGYASAQDIAAASTKTYNAEGQLTGAIINGVRVELDKANVSFGNAKGSVDNHTKSVKDNAGAHKELSNALRVVKEDLNQHGEKISEVRKEEFAYYENLRKLNEEYEKKSIEEYNRSLAEQIKQFDAAEDSILRYYGIFTKTTDATRAGAAANTSLASSFDRVASSATAAAAAQSAAAKANTNSQNIRDQLGTRDNYGKDTTTGGGMTGPLNGQFTLNWKGQPLTTYAYAGGLSYDDTTKLIDMQTQLDRVSGSSSASAGEIAAALGLPIRQQVGGTEFISKVQRVINAAGEAAYAAEHNPKIGNGGASVHSFATGGNFIVDGQPGTDTNLVQFYATKGEEVSVATPRNVRKGSNDNNSEPTTAAQDRRAIQIRVYAQDADSFRRTSRQTAQDARRLIQKAGG